MEVPEEAINMIREHKDKNNQLKEIIDEKKQLKEMDKDEHDGNKREKDDASINDKAKEKEPVIKSPTVWDLVRTPRIRLFTLVQLFIW